MTTPTKKNSKETTTQTKSTSKENSSKTTKTSSKTTLKSTKAQNEGQKEKNASSTQKKKTSNGIETQGANASSTAKKNKETTKSKITVEPTKAAQKAAENSTGAGQFVGAFSSQPTGQVIHPNEKKITQSTSKPSKASLSEKTTAHKASSSSSPKNQSKSHQAGQQSASFEDTVKTIGRQGAKALTHSILGNKAPEVSKQVEDLAGNIVSSLIDSWLK